MASVLFSTVGQALAGPLAGAVGAIAGGGLDAALGPRRPSLAPEAGLTDASYAVPLPRIYGRTRTAGVLVWALPPVVGGGGKGGSGNRHGLVTSVAVAVSARPIRRIGRIWADAREIRASDGRFVLPVTMRVHGGADASAADPVIVAAEGPGRAPAFRSLAYVVLENLPLGGFGNRIPALSFEVVADEADASRAVWLQDLCAVAGLDVPVGEVSGEATGFSASAANWRQDVADLAALLGAEPGLAGGRLGIGSGWTVHQVAADDLVVPDAPRSDGGYRVGTRLDERPASWTLSYLDPARDYQRSAQRAVSGETGRHVSTGAAITLDAAAARAAAERLLRQSRAAARRLDLTLSWKWAHIAPGDRLTLAGTSGQWRVVEREVAGLLVRLMCEAVAAGPPPAMAADPGRALLAPALPPGPSRIFWIEPPATPRPGGGAELLVLASGGTGWQGAALRVSDPDAGGVTAASTVEARAIHGTLSEPLAAGPTMLWDETGRIEVLTEPATDGLEGRSARGVLAGANLLLVGEELLQFRDAEETGAGRYRLSGLLRGRFFTEPAAHPAGTPWVLLDGAVPLALPIRGDWIDRSFRIEAIGPGDPPGGTTTNAVVRGASIAPLAPCHLQAERTAAGTWRLRFVPRERLWLDWTAGSPPPERRYRVHIWKTGTAGPVLSVETGGTTLELGAAEIHAMLGTDVSSLTIQVEVMGDGPAELRRTLDHVFSV